MRYLRPDQRSSRASLNVLALCCALGCANGTAESPASDGVGGGTTATGGTAGTAGAGSTGGSGVSGGSAGSAAGKGGSTSTGATGGTSSSGAGGATSSGGSGNAGSGNATSVDCDRIADAGFDVCESAGDGCTAVFTDGAGCSAVCAAAGLSCTAAYDNAEGACAGTDTEVECDSGHESDFCVCGGTPMTGAGGTSSTGGTSGTGGSSATGGSSGSGGSSMTGGTSGAGGSSATGGSSGSGGSAAGTGGTGQQPDVGPAPCGCTSPAGEYGTVSQSIVVRSGEVWDGECQIVRADPNALGDGTQAEGQDPVFVIEDGGTLRNVILGASAADGVHVEGDATLENVHWQDIGEDAMTIEGSGTVNLNCGSAQNGDDKVFQVNAASTLNITNFTARNAGKFIRQNGGTTFTINVTIDHCDISNMGEVIFRTDSSSSRVTLTNTRYSDISDGLFMFGSSVVDGNSNQSSVSNNTEY